MHKTKTESQYYYFIKNAFNFPCLEELEVFLINCNWDGNAKDLQTFDSR